MLYSSWAYSNAFMRVAPVRGDVVPAAQLEDSMDYLYDFFDQDLEPTQMSNNDRLD